MLIMHGTFEIFYKIEPKIFVMLILIGKGVFRKKVMGGTQINFGAKRRKIWGLQFLNRGLQKTGGPINPGPPVFWRPQS